MEFALRPLNHLIAIGPKLDGKILHIRASSFEWTAIFLIKMANMLHWICPAIIKRESWLIKLPRKAGTLNPTCERRFDYLT